jgi:formimidoylglutamate deiminase
VTASERAVWAPLAWVDGAWQKRVLLNIDAQGRWSTIEAGVDEAPDGASVVSGPALPGIVNAHSHAFQRAFAGRTEQRASAQDDFWSWREQMYAVASRISPDELRDVALALYDEMLRGGYTHVCEFHYLNLAPDARRYADPIAMSRALCDAASATGIGLTMLPVLYERAGFDDAPLRHEQQRFAAGVDDVIAYRDAIRALRLENVDAGVAIHSLRAARASSIAALGERCAADAGPIHIHVAEQTREVEECIASTGRRPIEWLAGNVALDARWQLVHATHATPAEIETVGARGAGVVLCPTTEANLGDGIADLPGWLASGTPLSIGSDSQVTRDWREELRLLEYGQRLVRRERNVAAAEVSTGTRLFAQVIRAGGMAAGFEAWGFTPGARADLAVVDAQDDALRDVAPAHLLDALVFVSPGRPFCDVLVGGRWAIRDGRPARRTG